MRKPLFLIAVCERARFSLFNHASSAQHLFVALQ